MYSQQSKSNRSESQSQREEIDWLDSTAGEIESNRIESNRHSKRCREDLTTELTTERIVQCTS